MAQEYFPIGIASGKAFLGREQECQHLANNIHKNRHTLLLSPRRYGKTSLVKHVLKQLNLPSFELDLFLTTEAKAVERKIIKGVKTLIDAISDTPEQWFKELVNYFRKANKRWSVAIKGFSIEIEPENNNDTASNILDALNALESLLTKKKLKAVLFIDEIQEIADIEHNKAIEGAIRHFAQESKYLTLIFSGSDRHMLMHMFGDRKRPLYELCDRLTLDRLTPAIYKQYLNKISLKTWKKQFNDAAFDEIVNLTECHPRVVYVFCGWIWNYCEKNKTPPSAKDIKHIWQLYINSKAKDIRKELISRSPGQVKLLTLIALGNVKALSGRVAQNMVNISGSAITQALRLLEEKDYIEPLENHTYRIIDPTLKAILIKYNTDT